MNEVVAEPKVDELDLTGWMVLKTAAGDVVGKVIEDVIGRRVLSPAFAYGFSVDTAPGPDGRAVLRPRRAVEPFQWLYGSTELVVDGASIGYRLDKLTAHEQREFRKLLAGVEQLRENMRAQQSGIQMARTMPNMNGKPVGLG